MVASIISITIIAFIVIVLLAFRDKLFGNKKLDDALREFLAEQYLSARQIFEDIFIQQADSSFLPWMMAKCSLKLSDSNRAVSEFRKVLKINTYNTTALESKEGFEISLIENFNEIGVHRILRDIFKKANNEDDCFTENQILAQLDPTNAEYMLAITESLLRKREYSERTLDFAKNAAQTNTESELAHFYCALIEFKNGNFNAASEYINNAIKISPAMLDAIYLKGELAYKNNLPDSAIEDLEKAKMSEHFQKSATFCLAKIFHQKGKFEEAESWALKSDKCAVSYLENSELEWETKYLLSIIYLDRKLTNKSHEVLQHIEKFNPGYKDVAEKLKTVSPQIEKEFIKDYITAKSDIFASMSEEVLSKLGYNVNKVEIMQEGNISILASSKDVSPKKFGVFIFRNFELINDDQIKRLLKYYQANNCNSGIFLNTGDFTNTAKDLASKSGIELFNGDQLESMLSQAVKTEI